MSDSKPVSAGEKDGLHCCTKCGQISLMSEAKAWRKMLRKAWWFGLTHPFISSAEEANQAELLVREHEMKFDGEKR